LIEVAVEVTTPLLKKSKTLRESLSEDATLGTLLATLADKYTPFRKLTEYEKQGGNSEVFVLINGRFPISSLNTRLTHGDEINIFHVATGG